MTPHEMTIQIARAEGVMMALYGVYRDMVVGFSVDEDKVGKMGDVLGDTMNGLMQVYNELEKADAKQHIDAVHAIDKIVGLIIEHAHSDTQFKLGEIIKYTPTEIGEILKEAVEK